MYLQSCDVAVAAASGFTGPNAVPQASNDPAVSSNYLTLITPSNVRPDALSPVLGRSTHVSQLLPAP